MQKLTSMSQAVPTGQAHRRSMQTAPPVHLHILWLLTTWLQGPVMDGLPVRVIADVGLGDADAVDGGLALLAAHQPGLTRRPPHSRRFRLPSQRSLHFKGPPDRCAI